LVKINLCRKRLQDIYNQSRAIMPVLTLTINQSQNHIVRPVPMLTIHWSTS